jgi:shikimate dehydrogenase
MTLTFALLGHPVSHSLSPQIHSAAYQQLSLPHRYVTIDCPDEAAVKSQVDRLRRGELAGLNVTVPWKRVALDLADAADESAKASGAANVLCWNNGQVVAHNTDAPALAKLLAEGRGQRESGGAVVLGHGGAALAAVVACRRAGAKNIHVTARKWSAASPQQSWPNHAEFTALGATPCAWGAPGDTSADSLQQAFKAAHIIVQSTSAGMSGVGHGSTVAEIVPWSELDRQVFLYDVVYNPALTPFLASAKDYGLKCEGGLTMLVGQAALGFELWLGLQAPFSPMKDAAERALFGALKQGTAE